MQDERAPPHVCENCRRWWRAQPIAARDDLVVCLHRKLAVRRTPSGWTRIDGVSCEEAKLLRGDPAMLDQRFAALDQGEQRERRQRAAVKESRRQTREERLSLLFTAADVQARTAAPKADGESLGEAHRAPQSAP